MILDVYQVSNGAAVHLVAADSPRHATKGLPAQDPAQEMSKRLVRGLMEPKHGESGELHSATFRFRLIDFRTQQASRHLLVRRLLPFVSSRRVRQVFANARFR